MVWGHATVLMGEGHTAPTPTHSFPLLVQLLLLLPVDLLKDLKPGGLILVSHLPGYDVLIGQSFCIRLLHGPQPSLHIIYSRAWCPLLFHSDMTTVPGRGTRGEGHIIQNIICVPVK